MPLGVFLAEQPSGVSEMEISLRELERVLGDSLPDRARYPVWWRNDGRREQARAWLLAGWRVESMDARQRQVRFVRHGEGSNSRPPRADD